MSKKYNIKIYNNNVINNEYNNINIIDQNKIIFILENTKTIIDNNILIRENKEFKFELDFNKNKSTFFLKEKNILYDIKVNNSSIIYEENKIIITYNIETNEEDIKIIIERCD